MLGAWGAAAPDELALLAEDRLRAGERRAAIRLRLLADACQTLLNEAPPHREPVRCRA